MPESSEWKMIVRQKLANHNLTYECMLNLWNQYTDKMKNTDSLNKEDIKAMATAGFNENIKSTKKWSIILPNMNDNDYAVMMYYTMPRPGLIVDVIDQIQSTQQYPILMRQLDKVDVNKLADNATKEYIKMCFNAETKIKALLKHEKR